MVVSARATAVPWWFLAAAALAYAALATAAVTGCATSTTTLDESGGSSTGCSDRTPPLFWVAATLPALALAAALWGGRRMAWLPLAASGLFAAWTVVQALAYAPYLLVAGVALLSAVGVWTRRQSRQGPEPASASGRPRGWIAIVALAAATALVSLVLLSTEVPRFWDPCHTWGMGNGGSLSSDSGCSSMTGSSETRQQAAARLAVVHGLLLLPAGLGASGAWRGRHGLLVAAAGLHLGAFVLAIWGFAWSIAPLPLASGIACLGVAMAGRKQAKSAPAAAV